MLEASGSLVWFLFCLYLPATILRVEVEGGKAGWFYFSGEILLDALDDLGRPCKREKAA